jgi:fimbrial chaperone protein
VRLLNTGDDPVTVQARVVSWSLKDNKDVYQESDEVLLNPPIFTLQPDRPQLMRLGLRHPRADGNEIAYRLLVEEVPAPPKPGLSLRTVLRISIPIFVEQQGAAKKQVDWKAEATPVGVRITAVNNGNVHVQIKHLDLLPEGSTATPSSKIVLDYLLPGQSHEWVFEEAQIRSARKLSLTAGTDEGNFSASLVPTTQ